jgi:GNAT superfamily N-acetyltransferase
MKSRLFSIVVLSCRASAADGIQASRQDSTPIVPNLFPQRAAIALGVDCCVASTMMDVRAAQPDDVDQLIAIWHDGWHDAHASILPEALVRLRTRDNFRERLACELDAVRVIGDPGAPVGFTMIRGDELYQFYVAPSARGTGVAAALMGDAEASFAARGITGPWLACAVGNVRAARFYEKSGWRRAGIVALEAETSAGPFPLQVWRYEKELA